MKKLFSAIFSIAAIVFAMSSCTKDANNAAFGGVELNAQLEKSSLGIVTPQPPLCDCTGPVISCPEIKEAEAAFMQLVGEVAPKGDLNYYGDTTCAFPYTAWYAVGVDLQLVNCQGDTTPVALYRNWHTQAFGLWYDYAHFLPVVPCCDATNGGLDIEFEGQTFKLAFAELWGTAKLIRSTPRGAKDLAIALDRKKTVTGFFLPDGAAKQPVTLRGMADAPTISPSWGGKYRIVKGVYAPTLKVLYVGKAYYLPNIPADKAWGWWYGTVRWLSH